MEVITFESKAYQELMMKLEQISQSLNQPKETLKEEKSDEWLDSNAVCRQLNISTRTLFRMKKERFISYSILRGRYRYKRSDVEQILHDRRIVSNPETPDELRQEYQSNHNKK
jgi:hypothetical protein